MPRARTTAAPLSTNNGVEGVDSSQRYTDAHRCPICNGAGDDPQGQGVRCIGYLTSNGQGAFCSREDYKGPLTTHPTAVGAVYLHHLKGMCGCGVGHEPVKSKGITTEQYASAKRIPLPFLQKLGLFDLTYTGDPAMGIPYLDPDGNGLVTQYRTALSGPDRFKWKKGDKAVLYGQQTLALGREQGAIAMVEGASDAQTLFFHNLPAVGLPGADNFDEKRDAHLFDGIARIYLNVETKDGKPDSPNVENLLAKLAKSSLKDRIYLVYLSPWGVKDPSALYLQDTAKFKENWTAAITAANSFAEWEQIERERQLEVLRAAAAPVLAAGDPLEYIRREFKRLGFGGDPRSAETVYLAVTSRLLSQQFGSMPAHTMLLAQSSSGKTWTVGFVRRLMPDDAVHIMDAGSPRALIYDKAPLKHRALFVGEADSIPNDPDNAATSAVRNLLQDNYLHYNVVEKGESGAHELRTIHREGPTVMVTTSTRRLEDQMDTRMFSLPIADDPKQIREVLAARAALDETPSPPPDPALIAFQSYLQALAPFNVIVPFAKPLAYHIGRSMAMPRIVRDFERILSMIKAVTILRHAKRQRRPDGRWVAEIEDYAAVHALIGEMFETSVTGINDKLRSIITAVAALEREPRRPITKTMVAKKLKIDKMSAGRHIEAAIKGGWVVNAETRSGRNAALQMGDSLPDYDGLPGPEVLGQIRHPVTTEV